MHESIFRPWQSKNNGGSKWKRYLKPFSHGPASRREPLEFNANATVKIETRLLDLTSRDHGSFPFLP
jgi:hypothetical protein